MVKHMNMGAAFFVAALLALLPSSPAQDVRAVDHYITDTAPVAGIGVGEASPSRARPPQPPSMRTGASRTPEAPSRGSSFLPDPPYISMETDRTVSYVEDVLAGREDVAKGIRDEVFESHDHRTPERTRPSPGYSRNGSPSAASGHEDDSRDRVATVYSSRDVGTPQRRHPDEEEGDTRSTLLSGSPREPTRTSGSGIETGYSRDEIRPVSSSRVVPVDSASQRRTQEDVRGIGSSRGSFSGSPREDDRSVPVRDSMSGVSNTRGYSQEEDESSVVSPYSGNVRKESRDPTSLNSRDPPESPSRDTASGRPRGGNPQDTSSYNSAERGFDDTRGGVSGYSRDTVDDRNPSGVYDDSRSTAKDDLQDELRDHLRETMFDRPRETVVSRPKDPLVNRPRDSTVDRNRDTVVDHSRDTVVDRPRGTVVDHSRDTVVSRPRDTVVDRPRETAYDQSRDTMVSPHRETMVDQPRETYFDNSRGTDVNRPRDTVVDSYRGTAIEQPRIPTDDYSPHALIEDSHDTVPYKSTTVGYHRESTTSNSWDAYGVDEKNSERDSELTRPVQYPRKEPVEEPVYFSKSAEDLESAFGFDTTDDDDIEGAHSSRPLPKTQKPRQVSAVPEKRGPRGPHPPSPCPSVFSYEGTRAGKERWYGVVLITTTETLTGIRLEITLDKRADLLGTWLGEVSSVDNLHFTIWNGRRRVEPGPPLSVKIFVKYNEHEYEPPRIRTIRLNGRQICTKDKVAPMPAPPRPPPRPNQQANRPGNQGNRPANQGNRPAVRPNRPANAGAQKPKPQGTAHKPSTTAHSTAGAELVDGVTCGRIDVQPTPLITYGQRTSRGQWPWHAAIYQSKGTDLSYICGGSLIGKQTVLTAAHCVSRRYIDRPVDPESLVIYLGKYNLKLWSEGGVQDKQVREVHIHPEYNSTDFRADIAILILSSPVEFSVYVKPVCLWDKNRPELNEIEGHEGVVVGWGYDETGTVTEDLMMAKMPVVSQQTCIWSYPQFFSHFTSDRTYCAGFRNGTSVCNGDSGGGMVFPKSTGLGSHGTIVTWALRGIVSLSTSQANKRVCNTEHYVVFTDIVKFYGWMKKYM